MAAVVEVGDGVSLQRHLGGVLAAVAVAARWVALVCVVLGFVVGVDERHFASLPLAIAGYVPAFAWSAVYLLKARRGRPALWVSAVDVAVVVAAMMAVRGAADGELFNDVNDSALEPFVCAVLVGVAIHASLRPMLWSCAVLGAAYLFTVTGSRSIAAFADSVANLAWLVGVGLVCLVGAVSLDRAAGAVGEAARLVVAEREALAESRGRDAERSRQRRVRRRYWLELHDGPVALLTAMSRPAPAGHPDPEIRARCAASADLLRGLVSEDFDQSHGTAQDLRLALVGAGADCAALGLRVRYQFGTLSAQVPAAVVEALRGATRAALNNVVAHAGTQTAWVTVEIGVDSPGAVAVDVVDRGVGFDPAEVTPGMGLPSAITGRMKAAGGTAEIDSAPGRGTSIRLRWPA